MISLYLARQSWLHRVPAGGKLLLLAGLSIALFPVVRLWVHILVLSAVLGLYVSLGREALAGLRILKPLLLVLGLLFVVQAFTLGWQSGALLVLRMVSLVLLANAVTMTTRMDDMMQAIRPLLAPLRLFGVEPARVAFAVALLIRFVPVLLSLTQHLLDAWKSRGGGRQLWRLAVPLLLNAIRMSDHVAEAVAARGGAAGQDKRKKRS